MHKKKFVDEPEIHKLYQNKAMKKDSSAAFNQRSVSSELTAGELARQVRSISLSATQDCSVIATRLNFLKNQQSHQ